MGERELRDGASGRLPAPDRGGDPFGGSAGRKDNVFAARGAEGEGSTGRAAPTEAAPEAAGGSGPGLGGASPDPGSSPADPLVPAPRADAFPVDPAIPVADRPHDPNGPSALKRRYLCPGSGALEAGHRMPADKAAREGTRKHRLIQDLLEGRAREDDVWDGDVLACMRFAREAVVSRGYEVHCELHLDLASLGIPRGGTADLVGVGPSSIVLVDWKFGTGSVDPPGWNLQLKALAIGAWERFGRMPVEAWIVQPNAPEGSVATRYEPGEEAAFRALVEAIVARARAPGAPLHAGEHCARCGARRACPERARAVERVPRHLDVAGYLEAVPPAERGRFLRDLRAARAWIEEALETAEDAAIARGLEFEGFEVAPGRATRAWRDGERAEEALRAACEAAGADPRSIYEPLRILSPRRAEDVVGRAVVERLAERLPGRPRLTPRRSPG